MPPNHAKPEGMMRLLRGVASFILAGSQVVVAVCGDGNRAEPATLTGRPATASGTAAATLQPSNLETG